MDVDTSIATNSSEHRPFTAGEELLLRETNHRWSNDLQLVVGLLALQGKRAANPEVRQALTDAMERVSIFSRARSAMCRDQQESLETALRQVCEALHAQAELRSISISLEAEGAADGLSERQITTLVLVVNELTTNAIKHAFEEGEAGHVCVSIVGDSRRDVVITVDDDGRPFGKAPSKGGGAGLELVKRLMASIGGVLIAPPQGSKHFELRVPRRE